MAKPTGRANARPVTCPPALNCRRTHARHPEEQRSCAPSRRMAAGACGPSFKVAARRRVPQDDGGVYQWWARRKARAFARPAQAREFSRAPPVNSGDSLSPHSCPRDMIAVQSLILRRWETIASVRSRSRDCPDLQRHPSRTRPGHRPPVQRSEIAR